MNIPLKRYWSLLAGYLRPQRARVTILALALVGGTALELLNPQILRYFIDTASTGGATESLMLAALLFIGMALVKQVLSICATYVSENVSWTAANALRADLAAHCLRLDLSFHKTRTPGELIERIDGDRPGRMRLPMIPPERTRPGLRHHDSSKVNLLIVYSIVLY